MKVTCTDQQTIFTVADTGISIPQADRERIFERFYRVDKSHSKQIGGTGLGLSIVKHGAQFHNATIELDSQLGSGTTITLFFPRSAEAAAQAESSARFDPLNVDIPGEAEAKLIQIRGGEEPAASTEPEYEPESAEEAAPEYEPEPAEEAEPEYEPEPAGEAEPEYEPEPAGEAEPEYEPELAGEAEPEYEPEPVEEAEPEYEPEPAEEAEPEYEPEPAGEAEPEYEPEPAGEAESEYEPEPVEETEPEYPDYVEQPLFTEPEPDSGSGQRGGSSAAPAHMLDETERLLNEACAALELDLFGDAGSEPEASAEAEPYYEEETEAEPYYEEDDGDLPAESDYPEADEVIPEPEEPVKEARRISIVPLDEDTMDIRI